MNPNRFRTCSFVVVLLLLIPPLAAAQLTTGSISGTVTDKSGAVVAGAEVAIRNLDTGFTRNMKSDGEGRYIFNGVPAGSYELTASAPSFAKYVRGPIVLQLNQNAVVSPLLVPAQASEVVTVTEDAPLVNSVNSEVGVRFDEKRLTDLPTLSTSAGGSLRDVFSFALSAPGVSQVNTNGNSAFANGPNFASNGMRIRSNNYMIDGQDSNDPSVTGRQQVMNNPDIIKEFHLITSQPTAEYGRAAGSVVSVITKGGTNNLHGSAFWFHNDKSLNSRSNIEKGTPSLNGKAPFRLENQYGGTFGGPIRHDKSFFFGSYQRWTDGNLGSGTRIDGVPTDAGRAVLQGAAGTRPQIAALLKYLPAAQVPLSTTASFCTNGAAASPTSPCPNGGSRLVVPLGSLSNSTRSIFSNDQASVRFDQNITANHIFGSRFLYSDTSQVGTGQANPPGNSNVSPNRTMAIATWLNSTLRPTMLNEARLSWQRLASATLSANPESEAIPSIEVAELGLTGFNAASSRTAIGLAINLPQSRRNNTYQLQDTLSWNRGNHQFKFGGDIRNIDVFSDFNPSIRGRVQYSTLDALVNDVASSGAINQLLTGGKRYIGYRWWDFYTFAQDTWRVSPTVTLNLGLRYENPGNALDALYRLNDQILAANGNNPAYRLNNRPGRDNNNIEPRVGFNWNVRGHSGFLGFLTGGDKTVVRGGYSKTHDYQFINLALNVASAFPFQAAFSLSSADLQGAFVKLHQQVLNPATASTTQTRTTIAPDFHSPEADQFSLEIQRGIGLNNVVRVGYVGTMGDGLFQSLDGNPVKPCALPVPSTGCPSTAAFRVDPTQGVIRLRANSADSIYHSLQLSYDRRFAHGFSAGAHYTWSAFIDTASDTFNPSVAGEIAVPQNSFNINQGERGRSTYDRPQRLSVNGYYELPFMRSQPGAIGRILGGWQISGFLTLQSGSPFTPLNGSDPSGATTGISALIGIPIRPMYNTSLNVSKMTLADLLAAGGRSLFTPITLASVNAGGPRLGNVGRNILRSDGINNLDVSFGKNIKVTEGQQIQFRADFFDATNTRDFGIPNATVTNAGFANEKTTDGGKRRIFLSLRYSF